MSLHSTACVHLHTNLIPGPCRTLPAPAESCDPMRTQKQAPRRCLSYWLFVYAWFAFSRDQQRFRPSLDAYNCSPCESLRDLAG